jgi:uncharacterized membrane-anchored protein
MTVSSSPGLRIATDSKLLILPILNLLHAIFHMKAFKPVVWSAIVLTAKVVGLLTYAIKCLITRSHFNNPKTTQWKVNKVEERDVELYIRESLMQPMSTLDREEAFTFPSN